MKTLLTILIAIIAFSGITFSNAHASTLIQRPLYIGLGNGLVGYWSFDGNTKTETQVYDLSGNGNSMIITNSVNFNIGRLGQAFVGDNSSANLQTSGDADVLDLTGSYTFSAWIYPLSLGGNSSGTIFDNHQDTAGYKVNATSSNRIAVTHGGTTVFSNNDAFNFNEWRHIVVVYNNPDARVYFYSNGVSVGSSAMASAPAGNSLVASIGATSAGNNAFNGRIDDMRIYNRVLSSQEVIQLYRVGNGGLNLSVLKRIINNPNTLDSGTNSTDGTSYTTNSISPTKNSLILLALHSRQGNGTNDDTPTVTGNNLTWYAVTAVLMGGSNLSRIQLFCAQGSKPESGALSIGFSKTKTSMGWSVSEFKNVNSIAGACNTTTVVQSGTANSGAASSLTINLNSFKKSTNRPFMFSMANAPGGITPKSGYTELSELAPSAGVELETEWNPDSPDNTPSASWANNNCAALAVEIDEGQVGTSTISASRYIGLNNGLIGYWSFNGADTDATVAYDRSGSANNGTLTNGPVTAIGRIGQALSFDGVNDYVNVADTAALRMGSISFTVSVWAKPASGDILQSMVAKLSSGAGNPGYFFCIAADSNCNSVGTKLNFYYGTNGATTHYRAYTAASVNDNKWHHFVAVADKDQLKIRLWVDGVEQATTLTQVGSWPNNTDTTALTIGQALSSTYFNGPLDEVRIYNRALSADEIKRLYNIGK